MVDAQTPCERLALSLGILLRPDDFPSDGCYREHLWQSIRDALAERNRPAESRSSNLLSVDIQLPSTRGSAHGGDDCGTN
jgi:hypothetical protein